MWCVWLSLSVLFKKATFAPLQNLVWNMMLWDWQAGLHIGNYEETLASQGMKAPPGQCWLLEGGIWKPCIWNVITGLRISHYVHKQIVDSSAISFLAAKSCLVFRHPKLRFQGLPFIHGQLERRMKGLSNTRENLTFSSCKHSYSWVRKRHWCWSTVASLQSGSHDTVHHAPILAYKKFPSPYQKESVFSVLWSFCHV